MTAKQYLMQAFRMKRKIEYLQEDILRLEAAATDCSPNLTGMPHNPSPSHSRMADIVCKIIDRKDELKKKVDELAQLSAEIQLTISRLRRALSVGIYTERHRATASSLHLPRCLKRVLR